MFRAHLEAGEVGSGLLLLLLLLFCPPFVAVAHAELPVPPLLVALLPVLPVLLLASVRPPPGIAAVPNCPSVSPPPGKMLLLLLLVPVPLPVPGTAALVSPQAPVTAAKSRTSLRAAGVEPQFSAWVIQMESVSRSKTAVVAGGEEHLCC